MITVKQTEQTNLSQLRRFLKKYGLDDSIFLDKMDQTMIISERDNILGFGAFHRQDTSGVIYAVLIEDDRLWPTMGDGLIKALLNTMDLRGIKDAYVCADTLHSGVYEKMGLVKSSKPLDSIIKNFNCPSVIKSIDHVYETTLPDFFNTACHSKK